MNNGALGALCMRLSLYGKAELTSGVQRTKTNNSEEHNVSGLDCTGIILLYMGIVYSTCTQMQS